MLRNQKIALPARTLSRVTLCRSHIRSGSKADIRTAKSHVRFTPESRHLQCISACPLRPNSGLMQRSKNDRNSITASARASSVGGIVKPSALAAFYDEFKLFGFA
jgi:hypothetical protein